MTHTIALFQTRSEECAKKLPKKFVLSLRKTDINIEIKSEPNTIAQLHEQMLLFRQRGHESIYQAILAYTKLLQINPEFWKTFGFNSLDCYLANYDLGSAGSLSRLHAQVLRFEKDTFILVGPELLSFMLRSLQTTLQTTKTADINEDVEEIFRLYEKSYDEFSPSDFRNVIWQYINKKYPTPKEEPKTKDAPYEEIKAKRKTDIDSVPCKRTPKNKTAFKDATCPRCEELELTVYDCLRYIDLLKDCITALYRGYKIPEEFSTIKKYRREKAKKKRQTQ